VSAQVAADLRAAADVLERDGWTQMTVLNPTTGCRCLTGALAWAASNGETSKPGLLPDFTETYNGETASAYDRWRAACDSLRQQIDDDGVVDWNDTLGRTADEVTAALRAAADTAEADS
jgi:hypothetical protein